MKLTIEQRGQLFARIVDALHREGILADALAELPAHIRQAFEAAAPSGDAQARVEAMLKGMNDDDRERHHHAYMAAMALRPHPYDGLRDRLGPDDAKNFRQMLINRRKGDAPDPGARARLEEMADAAALPPEQIEANRRARLAARARAFNEHLDALIELGPVKE